MSQVTKWDTKLNECISSIEDFYDYAPKIVSLLKENNPEYSNFFYKKISQLIVSKKNSPRSRFYSLYLLFKATENTDLASKTELLEDHALLTFLYRTAGVDANRKIPFNERGKMFFSVKPTAVQERIGINFVRLSLECLINWKANYSGKSASDNLSFYVNILQKEVKFPSFYNFIDRNYCLSTDLVTWDYEKRLPVISDESLEDRVDSQPTVREISAKKTSKEAKKLKPNLEIEVVEAKLTTQPSINAINTTKGESSISYQITSPLISPNGGLRSVCSSKSLLKFRPSNYKETFSRDLARINRSIERSKENTFFYKSPSREGTVEKREIESQKKVEVHGFKDLLWSPKTEKESIKIKNRLNQTTVQKIPKPNVVKANSEEEQEQEQSIWGKACQQRLKTLLVGYHVSVK